MNPTLKMPEGTIGHAAYGPFLNQDLLDKYKERQGQGATGKSVVRKSSHYRFPK